MQKYQDLYKYNTMFLTKKKQTNFIEKVKLALMNVLTK